ncbi:tol protein [Colletotrichum incanum]|uniref:Tol protein n=1 Tax=Colletotrichum incanum TaxID=1573173 RepID=A0A167EGD9_COLIC|nr:tol protein [Colletotrichum incanum]
MQSPRTPRSSLYSQLRAYSTFPKTLSNEFKRLPVKLLDQDIPHLAVVPSNSPIRPAHEAGTNFFFCSRTTEARRRVFQPQTLFPEIESATFIASLDFCKSRHKLLCGTKNNFATPSRLIDCHSSPPSVIKPQLGTPYIALSYIWGQNRHYESIWSTHQTEPIGPLEIPIPRCPRTVLDAQIVVRKLGYRYLWVDQICINQEDSNDKQSQIETMDQIYGGAELTIVAAAGSHSDHGLPGVAFTKRQVTRSLEFDGIRVTCMPNDAQSLIRSSTWSTRAWTHQEALLSRRLLFFTDSEAYFECHSMQVRESMRWDFNALHGKQGKLFSFFNSALFLQGMSHTDFYVRTHTSALLRFYRIVKDFTSRSMSCEEDALRDLIFGKL